MTALLSWLREPTEVRLALDVRASWYDWADGLAPLPKGTLRAVAKNAAAAKQQALKADKFVLLRREAVASVLPSGVLRDVELTVRNKVVSTEFALLDVTTFAPLDRTASKATWKEHWLVRLAKAAWSPERTPRAPIFRIGEASNELVVTDAIGTALTAATKKTFGVREVSEAELSQRAVHTNHPDAVSPLADPSSAEAAYWKLAHGEKADRKAACSSPAFAYWLASTVDGEPRKDTRAGALEHPVFAALYAVRVLGKPDAQFESITSSDWWAARYYAHFVSHTLSQAAEKTLVAAGYDLEEERAALAN
ncbi:MAG: hypothetical protein QM817_01165 [Archangium sp.]